MTVTATKQARQVAVEVYPVVLRWFIRQDAITPASKCTKGLPANAKFLRYDWDGEILMLIFEHGSFKEVRVGKPIPTFDLEFEDI
jgi:hypothetical protein